MYKPANLRQFLTTAIPELERDPDRLSIFINEGHVATTLAPGLSWEYTYTLELIFLEFAGDPDTIMAPLVTWLRTHQPDLVANSDQAAHAIQFEADILSDAAVDLSVKLGLTERVICKPRDSGGYTITHAPEPQPEAAYDATHWQLYVADQVTGDETLIAEWDTPST